MDFKENVSPEFNNYGTRKQVRFTTPSAKRKQTADSIFGDKPSQYFRNRDLNAEQLQKLSLTDEIKNAVPDHVLEFAEIVSSSPNKSLPKPSSELEFSTLTSDEDFVLYNKAKRSVKQPFSERLSSDNLPARLPQFEKVQPRNELARIVSPTSPCRSLDEEQTLYNFSIDEVRSAANSTKQFKNHSNVDPKDFDFFTLPDHSSPFLKPITRDAMPTNQKTKTHSNRNNNYSKNRSNCEKYTINYSDCCEKSPVERDRNKCKRNRSCRHSKYIANDNNCSMDDDDVCECKCNCSTKRNNSSGSLKKCDKTANGLEEKRNAIKIRCSDQDLSVGENKSDSEPTVTDLYKIIKTQSEQLQTLQQKVDQFMNDKMQNEQLHTLQQKVDQFMNNKTTCEIKSISTQHSHIEVTDNNVNKKTMNQNYIQSSRQIDEETHKISIGVMTSFEFLMSSKDQQSVHFADECVQTSCVQSDKENQGDNYSKPVLSGLKPNKADLEMSCMATESLIVKLQQSRSPPVSPPPSMHLNIDEYTDSEDDEDNQPDVGWTFYNNVMNHVNHLLYTKPSSPKKLKPKNQKYCSTFDVNSSKRVTFETRDNLILSRQKVKPCSETSLHMKNLAVKYLGHEADKDEIQEVPSENVFKHRKNNDHLADLKNEMSLYTLQYMQKYHLLSGQNENKIFNTEFRKKIHNQNIPTCLKRSYKIPSKILDITAIKQQSKLT